MKKFLLLFLLLSASAFSQTYTMQNGTFSTCSGTFYDSGGVAGLYSPFENYQITFCPPAPGTYVQLDFTLLDIEGLPFDIMTIYEGSGTSGAVIPLPTGSCASGTVASSHPSGCITITFISDDVVEFNGWAATISCTAIPGGVPSTGPSNAVCSGANPFCADAGPLEFPNVSDADCVSDAPQVVVDNTCLFSAPNPAWYYLEIDTPGVLNLLITQSTGPGGTGTGLDVDFAIWGPFPNTTVACADFTLGDCTGDHSCTGNVVDCSYNPAAIENATIPNALVGEIYMVLVTNFNGSPGYITMTQTNAGNVGAGSTDCSIVCPTTAGTNPACGASDGYITISGLDPNISYNINYLDDGTPVSVTLTSNAAGIAVISGLNAGNYTNIVTNMVGCTAAFTNVTLTSSAGPVLNPITGNGPICSGANAVFTLTGTPNTTVTYNINSGGNVTVALNAAGNAIVTVNGVTGNTTLNATLIANLASGCSTVLALSHVVVVSAAPTANITYSSAGYCTTAGTQLVTLTGTGSFSGGTYTASPAGLSISSVTGLITPASSSPGIYTITYTSAAAGGCPVATDATTVTITAAPTANISYPSAGYCTTAATQAVTLTGTGAFSGGTYTSSPGGLTINSTTGLVTPSSSAAGSYTVTYTIPASGGCASVPVTTIITITAAPTASISYPSVTYCSTATPQSVTLTGTGAYTGGTYTSTPAGLILDPATGEITPATSTSGSYTVTYTIPASGGCAAVPVTTTVNISTPPTANISYPSAIYCTTAPLQAVTLTGTGIFSGGVYSVSPSGLTLDAATGAVTPSTSTAGAYTVTYTIAAAGSCPAVVTTTIITITAAPTASISYPSVTYCSTATPQSVTLTGTGSYTGGTYTSTPAGLILDPATGEITPATSTSGSYTVTYTIPASGGCAAVPVTTTVNISTPPTANISYPSAIYCTTAPLQAVTLTGTGIFSGGVYSVSPSGLTLDAATGAVTPSTSTAGAYTVTYTIAAAGSCPAVVTTTIITITAAPTASISYASVTYCSTATPQSVTLTGTGSYTGGTYTSTPAGLILDPATGEITPATSTSGSYTVTYTIPASGGCAAVPVTTTVNISTPPTANISYPSAIYCTTAPLQAVTLTGTGIFSGGVYSVSPSGLTLDAATGAVTPSTSTAGAYTVTYTIAAAGSCPAVVTTTIITITAAPTASISYPSLTYCSTATPQSVTLTGTGSYTGGTYTSTPAGLILDPATGEITPATSTSGSYTVTYTIPASGGCAAVPVTTTVNISTPPTANISYPSAIYCTTAPLQAVTLTGTGIFSGGVYSVSPSGLTLDAATGAVTPSTSTAGAYTVTYTIAAAGSCPAVVTTTIITITAAPTASISYASVTYCSTATPQSVTLTGTGAYTGGTYTSTPAGLILDPATGEITPATSTSGSYTVTYTIPASGGCAAVPVTTTVNISTPPTANISYPSAIYCTTAPLQAVTLTGTGIFSGGVYSVSPSGLTLDAATGAVTPSTSTAGAYTVTYTIAAAGSCPAVVTTTIITITAAPTASISYASVTYCSTATPQSVTLTGTGSYTGGTYTSTPAGLILDPATGEITPATSTSGSYTVTYTIPASGGCAAVPVTTTVNISTPPTANISYPSAIYCTTAPLQAVTLTGTGIFSGGVYSVSPSGLTLDAATGAVTPSTSTAGAYTVTYTIAAAGSCPAVVTTTIITITAAPTASISYASVTYCSTATPQSVTLTGTGAYTGGTYTSTPAGLILDPATGEITPATSTSGSYTVTYTIPASGGCAAVPVTTTVNISTPPTANISYPSAIYCTTAPLQAVTLTGTGIFSGGVYSVSPSGLTLDAATGAVTPSTSTAGAYTVTYTIAAAGSCPAVVTTTIITITAAPTASISYPSVTYCSTATPQSVTLTGTGSYTGGTYTSTPAGLILDPATGEITPATSTSGSYTVTYTIPASGGCAAVPVTTTVNISTPPTAIISYTASPYCNTLGSAQPVTISGTGTYTGGLYTYSPSGLTIDTATGAIIPATSTAGTYSVTYTIPANNSCSAIPVTTTVIITIEPTAVISYAGTPYCQSLGSQSVNLSGTGAYTGGTYSSTPIGLSINNVTGAIDPNSSSAGIYTVTYTIPPSDGCGAVSVTTQVTITAPATAAISFSGTPYCATLATAQPVTIIGTGSYSGGIYSAIPAGLSISPLTGAIIPSASAAGTYTVTYTIPASGGCPAIPITTSVTITAPATASISYSASPYCDTLSVSQSVVLTGTGAFGGGTFGATPLGLTINATTGALIPGTSSPGFYTVVYTTPASGGCSGISVSTTVVITAEPTATISYAGSPYCTTLAIAQPLATMGTGAYMGGIYSALPAGLSINPLTGAIIPSSSAAGTYTVTYTIPASGGCPAIPITTSVTITAPATASISYPASPYCDTLSVSQSVVLNGTGAFSGGTFGATPLGLTINVSTGAIIPGTSSPGIYTVTYTTPASAGCSGVSVSTTLVITAEPTATISYAGSPYCKTIVGVQDVTITGSGVFLGGTYSATPSGLTINNVTGAVTPSTSTAGIYTVTYTIPAGGGCSPIAITTGVTIYPVPNVTATPSSVDLCTEEVVNIVLTGNVPGTTFSWTVQETNASGATSGIGNSISQMLTTTGSSQGIITYTVIPTANGCVGNPIIIIVRVNPLPIAQLVDGTICINPTTGIVVRDYMFDANLNDASHDFEWYFNSILIPGENDSTYTASEAGFYTVIATNTVTGCISLPVSATVTEAFVAQSLVISGNTSFVENPTVTVTVLGTGIYEYQLDDGNFQASNVFTNIPLGLHTITVRDSEGCTDITQTFVVIGYPNFFTPNSDGYNDTWNIEGLFDQPGARIHIFDRYGKLLKQISPQGIGWDGTLNGYPLPATDYWFTVDYMEQSIHKEFKSHFSLKR